jgi:hypothetical protein
MELTIFFLPSISGANPRLTLLPRKQMILADSPASYEE